MGENCLWLQDEKFGPEPLAQKRAHRLVHLEAGAHAAERVTVGLARVALNLRRLFRALTTPPRRGI